MDIKEIEKLAKLSRISLSEDEKKGFLADFKNILDYVAQIKEVVANPPAGGPSREAGELRNVMREDEEYKINLATREEILAEVPERKGDYVKVEQMF